MDFPEKKVIPPEAQEVPEKEVNLSGESQETLIQGYAAEPQASKVSLDPQTHHAIFNFRDEIKKELKEFDRKVGADKVSLIAALGIFASLITFVSSDIQILKSVCDPMRVLSIVLFLVALFLAFALTLQYTANSWISNELIADYNESGTAFELRTKQNASIKIAKYLAGAIVALIIGGVIIFSYSQNNQTCENKQASDDFEKIKKSWVEENSQTLTDLEVRIKFIELNSCR